MMVIDDFLFDPERIKWLANNSRFEVGSFQTNLTPEQLRLLTEELPYLLFYDDGTRNLEFRQEVFDMLLDGDGEFSFEFNDETITIDIKKRFIDAGLVFEGVASPDCGIPWYVCEDGFEACVLRVNGEIVVLFPGSQEMKEDWWKTDLKPNLLRNFKIKVGRIQF